MVTIGQLINFLDTLDPNLRVVKPGYEGGYSDLVLSGDIIHLDLNVNSEWYYGSHEFTDNTTSEKALVI